MNTLLKQIQDFLKVPIPDGIIDEDFEIIETLGNSRVREILPERDPQLYVEKAVFLNSGSKNLVLATISVTEKMCQGHFEWFLILPLALLGQGIAQVGAILISLMSEGDSTKIPLVVHVQDIRSISNKKKERQKDFIIPGDIMLVVANYLGGKFGFHKTNGYIYVDDIMMGMMEGIAYILVDKEYFHNRRQS